MKIINKYWNSLTGVIVVIITVGIAVNFGIFKIATLCAVAWLLFRPVASLQVGRLSVFLLAFSAFAVFFSQPDKAEPLFQLGCLGFFAAAVISFTEERNE